MSKSPESVVRPSNPVTVEDALAVRTALVASGKSLTERVDRYGSAETIGMLMNRLPASIRPTADLRATFEIHTPAPHPCETVEAAEHKHALDLQRLRDYAAEPESSKDELGTEVINAAVHWNANVYRQLTHPESLEAHRRLANAVDAYLGAAPERSVRRRLVVTPELHDLLEMHGGFDMDCFAITGPEKADAQELSELRTAFEVAAGPELDDECGFSP